MDGDKCKTCGELPVSELDGSLRCWKCGDDQLGDRPQQPDAKKPWCWNCLAHTKYTAKDVRDGDHSSIQRNCTDCGKIMVVPLSHKRFYIVLIIFASIFCFCGYWFVYLDEQREDKKLAMIIGVFSVSFCLYGPSLRGLFYLKWKRWAANLGRNTGAQN